MAPGGPGRAPRKNTQERKRETFDTRAKRRAEIYGITEDRARQDLLRGVIGSFGENLTKNRTFVPGDSDHFMSYAEALAATFSDKKEWPKMGRNSDYFRAFSIVPATGEEIEATHTYLTERYPGIDVPVPVAKEYTNLTRELEVIVQRLSSDARLSAPTGLAGVTGELDVRADMGRILEIKEELAMHERHLLSRMQAKEKREQQMANAREALDKRFEDPLGDFFSVWMRHSQTPGDLGSLFRMSWSFTPLLTGLAYKVGSKIYDFVKGAGSPGYAGARP